MSYSSVVLDHFHNPRNQYRMDAPDAVGIAGDPARGNFMVLFVRMRAGRIAEVSFQTHGCAPAIAAGSVLSEQLRGRTLEEAEAWTEPAVNEALGGLPVHKRYCSALAAAAVRALIGRLDRTLSRREDKEMETCRSG